MRKNKWRRTWVSKEAFDEMVRECVFLEEKLDDADYQTRLDLALHHDNNLPLTRLNKLYEWVKTGEVK